MAALDRTAHSEHSQLRERIVEHVFVGDALRTLWRRGVFDVEVLHSEFDAHGYDLVMTRGRIARHIQLRTSTSKKPRKVSVSQALAEKSSGCVIWIGVSDDLEIGPFFWFGGKPGKPLRPIDGYPLAKRTTHTDTSKHQPRKNHRLVPGDKFLPLATLDKVLETLFGRSLP